LAADLAPRQEGEVLVRAIYSGIRRGTEALVFRGEVPQSRLRHFPAKDQGLRAPPDATV